jgi:uncharacterized membrane protein
MEQLNMEYVLLAVLGIVIHACMKVIQRADKKKKFSLGLFLKDSMNWVRIVLSLASVVAILLMADDLAKVMGITVEEGTPARSILAFLAGYLNHSLIRDLLYRVKKQRDKADQ